MLGQLFCIFNICKNCGFSNFYKSGGFKFALKFVTWMKTRSSPRLPKIGTAVSRSRFFTTEKGEITYTRQGKVNHETLKSKIEKTLGEKN
jgi:hypothetical protein